jgi:hypothetical protein
MRKRSEAIGTPRHQSGVALLALLTVLSLFGLYLLVGQLSATQFQAARKQSDAEAMGEAKQALIADAISESSISQAGYLRLPDLGDQLVGKERVPVEGRASPSFLDNDKDLSVIGKIPWKTLASATLRDRHGQCLWYVVSGRFKISPKTDALNWDTQGQIDIIDGKGKVIATDIAALVVAPGIALDGQQREPADEAHRTAYGECGGNYNARNYLDEIDNDTITERNYFIGSTNNRLAPDGNNKSFVMTHSNADNDRFVTADSNANNDRFLYITGDDIFNPIIRRRDFAGAIGKLTSTDDPTGRLLDDPTFQEHLKTITIAGSKGTNNLKCDCKDPPACKTARNDSFQSFCNNWKEMLFLTELAPPSSITIDGGPSVGVCKLVLVFAGRKAAGQIRSTVPDKADKKNYLEGGNASSFSVPTAASPNFVGASVFDWRNPSADIVRCLP